MGDFIVIAAIVLIAALAVWSLLKDRKKGGCAGCSRCSGSCGHCSAGGSCDGKCEK